MLRRTTFTRTKQNLQLAALLAVCLQSAHAQSTGMATVVKQVGALSVMKDSSNYQLALFPGNKVGAGQVIVTGSDGYGLFQVADGSTFEVFPNSQVIFRNTMSIGDLLNVVIGKIKVMIQHAPGVPNPNNVSTPTALISVRGTVFVVDVQDEDGTTVVAVDEGVVDVRNVKRGGKVVTLLPGEATTVSPNEPLIGLGGNKGGAVYKIMRMGLDAIRDGLVRPGGSGGGTAGPTSTGGAQGDKGKPTGGNTGTGSPTGSSSPTGTGSPTGSGGQPPPPPPPGGGGGY